MVRAREAILAARRRRARNVFTRILLALYGDTLLEHALPTIPVELILLPRWFPIASVENVLLGAHGDRAASGAAGLRPLARNPRGVHVPELLRRARTCLRRERRTRTVTGPHFSTPSTGC